MLLLVKFNAVRLLKESQNQNLTFVIIQREILLKYLHARLEDEWREVFSDDGSSIKFRFGFDCQGRNPFVGGTESRHNLDGTSQ